MTSRQPGAMPLGIAGHAEAPGEGSEKHDGGGRTAGLTAQDWLVGVLPVALLIVAGLAGLRGVVGTLRWDGPLHRDAVVVGVVLEAVIMTLFVILLVRHGRGSQEPAAVKLRGCSCSCSARPGSAPACSCWRGCIRRGSAWDAGRCRSGGPRRRPRSRSGRTPDPGRRRISR